MDNRSPWYRGQMSILAPCKKRKKEKKNFDLFVYIDVFVNVQK